MVHNLTDSCLHEGSFCWMLSILLTLRLYCQSCTGAQVFRDKCLQRKLNYAIFTIVLYPFLVFAERHFFCLSGRAIECQSRCSRKPKLCGRLFGSEQRCRQWENRQIASLERLWVWVAVLWSTIEQAICFEGAMSMMFSLIPGSSNTDALNW